MNRILSMVPDLDQSLCNVLSAACTVGAEEALSAQSCSGYALAALLSNSEQGMFYPRGGCVLVSYVVSLLTRTVD